LARNSTRAATRLRIAQPAPSHQISGSDSFAAEISASKAYPLARNKEARLRDLAKIVHLEFKQVSGRTFKDSQSG
jgi:hypothetical protein